MKITAWLASGLLLGACNAADETPDATDAGAFDDLTGTLERADDVERQVLEQKRRLDDALDAAADADDERAP